MEDECSKFHLSKIDSGQICFKSRELSYPKFIDREVKKTFM